MIRSATARPRRSASRQGGPFAWLIAKRRIDELHRLSARAFAREILSDALVALTLRPAVLTSCTDYACSLARVVDSAYGPSFWLTLGAFGGSRPPYNHGILIVYSLPVRLSPPLVLIVDDDRDTRELYRIVLESVGYRVEEASRIADAADTLKNTVPDVVMTDWLLPDGNGLDVCRAVHARTATRGISIVAVTGLAFDDGGAEAKRHGVATLIPKPADPDVILAAIGQALTAGTERRVRAAALRAKRYLAQARKRTREQHPDAVESRADAEALLCRAAAKSGDSVTLMIADDTAHYVAVCGATHKLTGYEARELSGMTVWDLTPVPSAVDPQGLWNEFIAAGTQEGDYVLRRRDGRSVSAHYVALANVTPGWHVSAIAELPQMPTTLGNF